MAEANCGMSRLKPASRTSICCFRTATAWTAFGADESTATVKDAACRRQYRPQAVSRYLNLGEILANYQAAHARAAPEPPTAKELQDRAFRNGH